MANIFAVRGSPSGYFNIFAIRPVRLSLLQLLLHPLRFSFLSPCQRFPLLLTPFASLYDTSWASSPQFSFLSFLPSAHVKIYKIHLPLLVLKISTILTHKKMDRIFCAILLNIDGMSQRYACVSIVCIFCQHITQHCHSCTYHTCSPSPYKEKEKKSYSLCYEQDENNVNATKEAREELAHTFNKD